MVGDEVRAAKISHFIPESLVGAKVADLVNDQMEWNWNILEGWLPSV